MIKLLFILLLYAFITLLTESAIKRLKLKFSILDRTVMAFTFAGPITLVIWLIIVIILIAV